MVYNITNYFIALQVLINIWNCDLFQDYQNMYFKCLVKYWLHICSCFSVSDVETSWLAWYLVYFVTKFYIIYGQSISCNTSLIMLSNCSEKIPCEIYGGICYKFCIWYYVHTLQISICQKEDINAYQGICDSWWH